ncbi:hypothetical protein F5Y16DRAFT_358347 [Xylariaceae sp. FL0255]|nr:hypothetical protein F5Y16DRAFT_358347 [Xylariaceae sp. FL0255]
MSNSQPDQAAAMVAPSSSSSAPAKSDYHNPFIHYVALFVTPISAIGLLLPPRRLEFRAFVLGGVVVWGTNQLAHDYSGKSFNMRIAEKAAVYTGTELSDKAKETRAKILEDKDRRAKIKFLHDELAKAGEGQTIESLSPESRALLLEAFEKKRKEEEEAKEKSLLNRVWMGDAAPDWKEKRDAKEKEALKEGGGGYLGLITDQLSEVWSGGKKDKDGENTKKDEPKQ